MMKSWQALIIVTLPLFSWSFLASAADQQAKDKEHQSQVEEKVKDLGTKLDSLGKKAAEIKEDLRVEFKAQMDELRKKLDAADRKLQELKDAGSKEWERVKAETDAAVAEVERLYREAADRFK